MSLLVKFLFVRSKLFYVLRLHIRWITDNHVKLPVLKVVWINFLYKTVRNFRRREKTVAKENVVVQIWKNRVVLGKTVDIFIFQQFQQKPKLTSFNSIQVLVNAKDAIRQQLSLNVIWQFVRLNICLNEL